MFSHRTSTASALFLATWLSAPTVALAADGPEADTEHIVQAYLALWSRNDRINSASVARFYAPSVSYYGKQMSREQVLADKRSYIRVWPVRSYAEAPGSLRGACNADRSRCTVTFNMDWRRVGRDARVVAGHAHMQFVFVAAEGGRKIAKESARFF